MIKSWQEFLLEAVYKRPSRGEVIEGSPDEIEEILKKWAPWYDPIDVKMPLFRSVMVGTTSKPYYPYKVMDPKKFVRKPPSTENYYNVIIDNSESWKDYPKRSRSIMTHTMVQKTLLYGNKTYRVIPLKENAKCSYVTNDYWMAFSELFKNWPFGKIESLNEFNQSLRNVFELPRKDYTSNRLRQLLSSGNMNKENLMYDAGASTWRKSIIDIEKKYGDFYSWIDSQMVPENTSIKLFDYNNETLLPHDERRSAPDYEVWTDEKCLLIDNDILRSLYIKKKNPSSDEFFYRKF